MESGESGKESLKRWDLSFEWKTRGVTDNPGGDRQTTNDPQFSNQINADASYTHPLIRGDLAPVCAVTKRVIRKSGWINRNFLVKRFRSESPAFGIEMCSDEFFLKHALLGAEFGGTEKISQTKNFSMTFIQKIISILTPKISHNLF